MDPYHRYADDPISVRNLSRLDYTPAQINRIRTEKEKTEAVNAAIREFLK